MTVMWTSAIIRVSVRAYIIGEENMRLATFLDMSYIKCCKVDFQVDFKKLVNKIATITQNHFGDNGSQDLTIVRNIVVASIPMNVTADDYYLTNRLQSLYNILATFPNFEVKVIPVDYCGYHLHKENRNNSTNPYERDFSPHEKEVDTYLVTRIMELFYRDRAIDTACVISGDADMIPPMISMRMSGGNVIVAGLNIHNTLGCRFAEENIPCLELIHYRDEIERNFKIDIAVQIQIERLAREIKNSLEALNEWDHRTLLAWLKLCSSKARLLNGKAGDDRSHEDLREIFSLLSKIARDYGSGYIPALNHTRAHIADWGKITENAERELTLIS